MNAVLFDEFPILVDRVLAENIGLNEAIVIQQLHYWIIQNKRNNKNFIDGKYWTYNSFEKWHKETFYFWSEKTVKRIFKKLEDDGILATGNYNKRAYDRTKWYSINYEKLNEIIENAHKDRLSQWIGTDCPNASGQNDPMDKDKMTRPIPKTNQDTKTDINHNLEVVVDKIKSYFDLNENDIEKVASAHLATSKEIGYLIEKLELTKSKNNIQDITGYLIAALRNDYKPIITQPKCFIPGAGIKTKFHNCNESFSKYAPDELEKMLLEQQKNKWEQ